MSSEIKKICFALLLGTVSLFASDIETISKTNGVLSSELLLSFKELFGIHSFIETGTYAGNTTAEASKIFKEVHSIEIWEPLYRAAQRRFALSSNVTLYLGDTTTRLKEMIENSSPKRLYWLDAHCSGGGTGGVPGFSPILDELDQILSCKGEMDSIILIDDLRGMCHCDSRTNLPLRSIIQKIKERCHDDLQFYSIGDIGIIFNERSYPFISVSEIVKKASISRFFDPECEDEESLEQLIDAESFIASLNENTREGKNFGQLIRWVDDKSNLGGEIVYLLWESLRELEKGEFASAIHNLQLITKSFYSHWRMDAYLVKAFILDNQLDKAASLFNERLLQVYAQHPKIIQKIIEFGFLIPPSANNLALARSKFQSNSGSIMRGKFFLALLLTPFLYSEIQQVVLQLEGLACPFCNTHVVRKLEQLPGISDFQLDLHPNMASFGWLNQSSFCAANFYDLVDRCGYGLKSITLSATGKILFQDGTAVFVSSGDNSRFSLPDYRGGEKSSITVCGSVNYDQEMTLLRRP